MRFSKKKGRQIASALAPKRPSLQSRIQDARQKSTYKIMNSTHRRDEFNIEEDVSTQKMKPY